MKGKQYDFDTVVNRRDTSAMKYTLLQESFGSSDLLPLWIADMDFPCCPDITQALVNRLQQCPVYGYTDVMPDYWESVIDWQRERNGFEFTRDQVCYIGGIVNGFGLALNYFTAPGDKVVIQEPVYHPFRYLIEGNGRVVANNALQRTPDGFYRMDLEGLERIFEQERPRMMVLCNPHNPVGIAWSPDVLRQVAALARRFGVVVFSDEIHGDLMLYGHRHTPFLTVSDDAAAVGLVMGAPSKTFNIAGIVSSWCVMKNLDLGSEGKPQKFFRWLGINEQNTPNFLSMTATTAAYRHGGEWLKQCLQYIEANIDHVASYCREHLSGITAIKPQASFLVWLDCTALHLTHDQLMDLMVNKAKLALNDGATFGEAGNGFLRLNVATPRSVLDEALHRLEAAVKQL